MYEAKTCTLFIIIMYTVNHFANLYNFFTINIICILCTDSQFHTVVRTYLISPGNKQGEKNILI